MTAILGYARVSTLGQDLDAQLAALDFAGVAADRVFTDKLSGSANAARPGLAAMLDYARAGDTVVVAAIDRLGRSVAEVTRTIATLGERRITLRALREGVDTATPTGRAIAAIMATLAELELELGRERRASSRQSRRARKLPATKPPKLGPDRQEQLRRLAATGESVRELAAAFGIGRATAYRYLATGRSGQSVVGGGEGAGGQDLLKGARVPVGGGAGQHAVGLGVELLRGRGLQIGLGLLFCGGGLAESDHCDDRPNEGDHGDDGGGGQHGAQDAGAFAQRGGVRLGGLLAFPGGPQLAVGAAGFHHQPFVDEPVDQWAAVVGQLGPAGPPAHRGVGVGVGVDGGQPRDERRAQQLELVASLGWVGGQDAVDLGVHHPA